MGIPLTYVNGTGPLTDWHYTGADNITTDLRYAYMNGVLIFEKALTLILPCNPNYTLLNLEDFIRARNPYNYRIINVFQESGCSHPTIHTGDLSDWYVFLNINGSLEAGTASSDSALTLTSALTLVNNGYIRGYGGKGGNGGKGHDGKSYSSTSTSCSTQYSQGTYHWYSTCGPCHASRNVTVTYKWGSAGGTVTTCHDCPSQPTSYNAGGGVKYKRSGGAKTGNGSVCDGNDYDYYAIERCATTTINEVGGDGGDGGEGGDGQYYKHPAEAGDSGDQGDPGNKPETTRGYTGCKGGDGGSWSLRGEDGKTSSKCYNGTSGRQGGAAIRGKIRLNSDSVLNDAGSPDRVVGAIL